LEVTSSWAADVGRLVFFFSSPEDEEPDIIFQAGKFNFAPFPQLCDILARSLSRTSEDVPEGPATGRMAGPFGRFLLPGPRATTLS
jgi:hypothetical protein